MPFDLAPTQHSLLKVEFSGEAILAQNDGSAASLQLLAQQMPSGAQHLRYHPGHNALQFTSRIDK
jgi:hypothetical protein